MIKRLLILATGVVLNFSSPVWAMDPPVDNEPKLTQGAQGEDPLAVDSLLKAAAAGNLAPGAYGINMEGLTDPSQPLVITITAENQNPDLCTLSFHGGGVKGYIEALVAQEIERRTGKRIYELFDIVGGTSTGGILAAALTVRKPGSDQPYTATEAVEIFKTLGGKIFNRSVWEKIKTMNGLVRAKFGADYLEAAFLEYFGDSTLQDVMPGVTLVIPAVNEKEQGLFIFGSHKAKLDVQDDFLIRNALRATSAAPTFFIPAFIKDALGKKEYVFTDGGQADNCADDTLFINGLHLYPDAKHRLMISVGSGHAPTGVDVSDINSWGLIQWAPKVIDNAMVAATAKVTGLMALQHNKPDQDPWYLYLNPELKHGSMDMSDGSPANIVNLGLDTKAMLTAKERDLERFCDLLKNRNPKVPLNEWGVPTGPAHEVAAFTGPTTSVLLEVPGAATNEAAVANLSPMIGGTVVEEGENKTTGLDPKIWEGGI